MERTFRDADKAFDQAIAEGRLSADEGSPYWAGDHMYMGTVDGRDQFKHIALRVYID